MSGYGGAQFAIQRRDDMNAETVQVNLRYRRADLESLFTYARTQIVAHNGKYAVKRPSRINIWAHKWCHPARMAEPTLMFSLEYDWGTASLRSVTLQPGFGWRVFLDELTRLERVALGNVVYGLRRCEPTMRNRDAGGLSNHRSREAGFAPHLTKPASREAVFEAIAAVSAEE
jgi:hypothetical protein